MCKDAKIKFENWKLLSIIDLHPLTNNCIIQYPFHNVRETLSGGSPPEKIFRIALSAMLENAPLQDRRCANMLLDGQQRTLCFFSYSAKKTIARRQVIKIQGLHRILHHFYCISDDFANCTIRHFTFYTQAQG